MEDTYKQKLEALKSKLEARIEMLDNHIIQYVEAGNYSEANESNVKRSTLEIILIDIKISLT